MLLVIGATGQIGKHLVQDLKARKTPFKAMVRKEAVRADLEGQGIQAVVGDFTQPPSYLKALAGVKDVFLLTTPNRDLVQQEGAFLTAAHKAGVRRVVRLSAMGANPSSASPLLRIHGQCEAQLEASGLAWTILRPSMFMQNLASMYGESVATTATMFAPAGDARIPMVDTRDIAAVAATVLATKDHDGLIYEITGPEAYTYSEIAELVGAQLGRTVKYVDVPDDAAYHSMVDRGMSGWFAHSIITLFHHFRANAHTAVVMGTVARLTGHPARNLPSYLQEHLQAFRTVAKPGALTHTHS